MLNFIILAYSLGPIAAIPYALHELMMSPLKIFLYLTILYIIQIPVIFKVIEFGGRHKEMYKKTIFRKAARFGNEEEVLHLGDKITEAFQRELGHLGFYFAISIFTMLFGIIWAALFSYALMVKRKRAVFSIAVGVVLGNVFWLLLISYFRTMITTVDMILIALIIPLLIYGSMREMRVIKNIIHKFRLKRRKRQVN